MWKLAEDTITEKDIADLIGWLNTNPKLTQGDLVKQFEKEWAAWCDVKHAIMVSSGTTANMMLILGAQYYLNKKNLNIGVAAVTWSTNWTPALAFNHKLVVFDVDKHHLGVDEAQVINAIKSKSIDVLFVTHLLGFNCLTENIIAEAKANNVILLEDCCESHGVEFNDKKVGQFGLGGSFSSYYGHHMSTIEGGFVITNDDRFNDLMRLIRSHGLARESPNFEDYKKQYPDIDPQFLFILPGFNFRSSDLNARLGLSQLQKLDDRIKVRNDNLSTFLQNLPDEYWKDYNLTGASSFSLPLISKTQRGFDVAKKVAMELDIEHRPIVGGNLLKQPLAKWALDHDLLTNEPTPVSDHVHSYGLYLGNGHHVNEKLILEFCLKLKEELSKV